MQAKREKRNANVEKCEIDKHRLIKKFHQPSKPPSQHQPTLPRPTLVAASDYYEYNPGKTQIKASTSTRKLIIKTDKKSKIIIRVNQDAGENANAEIGITKNYTNTHTYRQNH